MIINIMSYSKAKKESYRLHCKTAIISISNILGESGHFLRTDNLKNILHLYFDDVGDDDSFCMTKKDADEIRFF